MNPRSLLSVAVLALLAVPAATSALAPAAAPPAWPDVIDESWLAEVEHAYADLPGFLTVGFARYPEPHVAVLFDGAPPTGVPALHPTLATAAYDAAPAPVTHGPIVPVMKLAAQQVTSGIRPGAWMTSPYACTMAFVVEDDLGATYILTAGHCVDRVGQRVGLRADGEIGHVVAFRNAGVGHDFALVSVDAAKLHLVDANMQGWNGPTGIATSPDGGSVKHYGWGAATWMAHATRCREGSDVSFWSNNAFGFYSVILWGDSGSGSQTADGAALGMNTHLSLDPTVAGSYGTRTTYALSELSKSTGRTYTVVTGDPVNDMCEIL